MGNQNFLWSDPFNWAGLAAPATGETNLIIVLPNNASPRTTTNDIAGLVIKSIRFQGDNYIVAGKTPGNSLALTYDRFSGDSIEVTGNNCQFAPTLSIVLTNDITIDVAGGKTFNLRSSMTGPGGATKLNMGTLHFNSPGNGYLGDTYVTDGIVDLECGLFGPSVAIPGPLFIGGTNLLLSPVVRYLNDDQIADTAPVTVNANAKLWLNTHDDVLGSLTMNGGLVNTGLGGNNTTPGTLELNGNVTNNASPVVNFATISGKLALGAVSRTFNVASGQLGIDAIISGTGAGNPGITKIGPGILSLYNATNTYVGPTLVQEGVLDIAGSTQPLGATNSGTTVSAGAQLMLESVTIGQEALTLNGAVTNDVFVFAGSNFWSGPVNVGFARIYGATNETMNFGGPISGGTFKATGRGNIFLTGSNANTFGDLIVDRGNIYLAKSPNVDAFGGRVFIGNTNDPQLQAYVIIKANNQFPTMGPATIYPSGVLGTQGADDAVGNVTIQGGWMVNIGGKFTLNGNVTNLFSTYNGFMAGDIVLANFQRIFHCAANSTLYGGSTISDPGGNGGITKTGPGRLILADPNSYTGPTLVQDGFLVLEDQGLPGAAAGGTEIYSPAVLQLDHAHVTNELLTLHGNAGNYSIYVRDQCAWIGNVVLLADSTVQFENANGLVNKLEIGGAISGAGGLNVDGDGELILSGAGDNTFAGPLWLRSSDGTLTKSGGATAVSSMLRVGDNSGGAMHHTKLGANNQIANNSLLEILVNGEFSLNGFNDTIGALSLTSGGIAPSGGLLTLNGNITNHYLPPGFSSVYCNVSLGGATRTIFTEPASSMGFYGDIQDGGGASGITITGGGRVAFNNKTTYGGQTLVNASTLDLNNNATPGNSAGGTQISPGGHLNLLNVRVTNETLILYGDAGSPQLTFETDSNVWNGPIQLLGNATFNGQPETFPSFVPAQLLINGVISGSGGVTLDGQSYVSFIGDAANIYGGATTVKSGWLFAGKNAVVPNNFAVPGNLVIGMTNMTNNAIVRTTANNQFASGAALTHTMNPHAFLDCDGFNQTIPALTIRNASLETDAGVLTLAGDVMVDHEPGFFPWSSMSGHISLGAGTNGTRTIVTTNNGVLDMYAEIASPGIATNLFKTGFGSIWLESSNTFTGTLTVEQGKVEMYHEHALGAPAFGTIIQTNGYLVIGNYGSSTQHIAEPFAIHGNPLGYYALYSEGTNELTGPIALFGDSVLSLNPLSLLDVRGAMSGAGANLRKEGPGVMRLSGTNANTFDGTTWLADGILELARTNAIAIAGPLQVGNDFGAPGTVLARWFQSNQVADSSAVLVNVSGQIELQNHNETIGSLAGPGNVLLGSATLTAGGDGTSTSFDGFMAGIGGQLIKTGAGTMTLSANNSYTGGSTVNAGTLLVNGQQPQSPVSLLTGGQVGGNGRVGNVSALNGHVAPGASPGKLACGNLSFFSPSSLLKIEIGGTNAGVTYDQVDVNGSVLLMGGGLQVSMNFAGAVSNQYVIVKNDLADPISGTFTGITNGASITNNGTIFVVKYNGGDGNDVVLIQQNVSVGPQIGGIRQISPGRMQINAIGVPNTLYGVQATTNLNPPAVWSVIGSTMSDGTGLMSFVDSQAGNYSMRFYRFALP